MICLKSYAKLNLYLHVLGKVSIGKYNGYHLIDSVMVLIKDVYDEISLVESDKLTININIPILNSTIDRVFFYLEKITGLNIKYNISLKKNIPIGSGLGGGSSNAATLLLYFQKKYSISLEVINDIALKVGIDTVFFLKQQSSRVFGLGDILTPINISKKKKFILVVNDGIHISSKGVYSKLYLDNTIKYAIKYNSLDDLLLSTTNDLYETARKINPNIENIINVINSQKNCICSKMSGSGGSCFGIFHCYEDVKIALNNIKNINKNWWYAISELEI
ncbi:MAG: hypothetical protein OEY79_02535 [Anaplasmataceae bacterium]|nr:hypothetical protein [Anaplasmataceae bacterium]